MFEWMNRHKKDIMKYTLWLVIPSFIVLYGYGECAKPQRMEWVARVNGTDISEFEWSQWIDSIQNRMQQYGQEVDREELRGQALDTSITLALNRQKAETYGLQTLDAEVSKNIRDMSYFKNQAGTFDINMYRGILQQIGKHPIQFEEEQRDVITRTKLQALVSNSLFPAGNEINRLEEREGQSIRIDYLAFTPSRYVDDVTPEAEGLQKFFEAHREDYRIADQRSIAYARFQPANYIVEATFSEYQLNRYYDENREKYKRPDSVKLEYLTYEALNFVDQAQASEEEILAHYEANKSTYNHPPQVQIRYIQQPLVDLIGSQVASEEEIQEYYEKNSSRYTHKEQAKARHILRKVAEKASAEEDEAAKNRILEIRKEIEGGLSFDEAAKKYSECPSADKGGDLGYFGRSDMAAPFAKASFELPLGQISEPVKTQFGYHLILVEDRKEEGVDSLDSVREEISIVVRKRKALDALRAEMAQLQSLDAVADRFEIKTSDWFERATNLPGMNPGESSLVSSAAFRNDPSSSIAVVGYPEYDNVFVIERMGKRDSSPQTLEEAREKVIAAVKNGKAESLAQAAAQADLAQIRSASATLDAISQSRGIPMETSDFFTRSDPFVRGFGMQPTELISTAFTLNQGEIGGPVKTQSGYHIIRVTAREPEHIPAMAEVLQQVEQDCLMNNAEQKARLEARKFSDVLFNQQLALEVGAASDQVDWGTTGFFTVRDPLPGIGSQPTLNYKAFQIEEIGEISEAVPVTARRSMNPNEAQGVESYYIMQLKEIKETYLPELSEVQEKVEADYRLKLAEELAERHAAEALEEVRQAISSSQSLSATQAIDLKTFEDVDNKKVTAKGGQYNEPKEITGNGTVPGLAGRPWPITKTALALQPGQVSGLVKCYQEKRTKDGEVVQGPMLGVFILQVLDKKGPDAEAVKPATTAQDQLERRLQSVAFEAWIDEVSTAAKIEYNDEILFPDKKDESMEEKETEAKTEAESTDTSAS